MRIGYFDCFSGAAGDMILAAMVDAGLPVGFLHATIARLNLPGVTLHAEKTQRGGLAATHVRVEVPGHTREAGADSVPGENPAHPAHSHAHGGGAPAHSAAPPPLPHHHSHSHSSSTPHGRHASHRLLPDILKIIDAAALPPEVAQRAGRVFHRLAEAEAAVHGTTPDRVHFHEVGGEDAIVDIVCACAGMSELGIGELVCSPIPTGAGAVRCAHGLMPIPAPATAILLRDVPLAACDEPGELTTPTGAALLTTLARRFGTLPAGRITAIGYGAGTRPGTTRPNVSRLLILESDPPAGESDENDVVAGREAQLDDATGQQIAEACERALAAGALDAYVTAVQMKKGRPGQLVTLLCRPDDAARLADLLLHHTPTFGVRRQDASRRKLARTHVHVETRFGQIRLKIGRAGGEVVHAEPEFADCAAAARAQDVPLQEVREAAISAWRGLPPSQRL